MTGLAAMIDTEIAAIMAIVVEFNTPAFDCGVGKTLQMYNKVTNFSDVDIVFNWAE